MAFPRSLRGVPGLRRDIVRKALSLALAAWLSFAVAALLHVDNAYWAAMPVWVLTQPSRGLVLERALFRVIGTLIGAAAGFALMNVPVPPAAQLALLAAWLAVNAGLTHVLRGVHGYGALLAGMTAAIVVIPSVLTPSDSIDLAIVRVTCTLIGVVVSTLVLALLTPVAPLAEFYAQIRAVASEAVAYAARVLREGAEADDRGEERRILALISTLESSARLNAAGSVEGYRRLGDVDLLVVGSLSAMAAAQAARDARVRRATPLLVRLDRVANHLRGAVDRPLRAAERRFETSGDPALVRLENAVRQILDADDALNRPASERARPGRGAGLAPHREWSLARQAGTIAGVAVILASALALARPSPAVQLVALGVCIFVMVLGSLPLPQLLAPKLLAGVVAGVVFAIFYRIVVQPGVASTAGLLLTLAPFMLLGGFARAHPRTGAAGIDANMCFLLASQAGMPATEDLGVIFGEAAALALAAGVVATSFMLLPRRATREAADAAAVIRRDLQRILEERSGPEAGDWQARGARQVLRLTLHLGRAKEFADRWPDGLLATLNLGHALIELRRGGMPDRVGETFAALLRGQTAPTAAAHALRGLAQEAGDEARARLLSMLAKSVADAGELLAFGIDDVPARPA